MGTRKANRIELLDESVSKGYVRSLNVTGTNLAGTVSGSAGTLAWSGREVLTAARTYYVRTDGSDSNTGLVNNAGGAFLTIQKALDTAYTLDNGGFDVTVQVANGTYTTAISISGALVGRGTVRVVGDTTTPANVVLNPAGTCVYLNLGAKLRIGGIKFQTTGGHGLFCQAASTLVIDGKVDFGAMAGGYHCVSIGQSVIEINVAYNITGGAVFHWYADRLGVISAAALNPVALSGTPAFATFANASGGANMTVPSNTFTGSATGQRYSVTSNASVYTAGGGATYLPGNSAGSTAPDGEYT